MKCGIFFYVRVEFFTKNCFKLINGIIRIAEKSGWIIGIAEKKLQRKSSERIIGIIGIANSKKCSQKTVLCKKIQP